MSSMDEYLATLAPEQRAALEHVRTVVRELVPEAAEGRSYGVPAFIVGGRPLLGLAAAKAGHLSVYPFSPAALDTVRERLEGFELSKGTVRFTAERPLPDDVLADLVRARLAELDTGG